MNIKTVWCHRCGKYVEAEVVEQDVVAPLHDDAGNFIADHRAAVIQCKPHHHALLSVGLESHGDV